MKNINKTFDNVFTIMFLITFFLGVNYLNLSQQGATGLESPTNGAIWICVSIFVALSFYKILFTESVRISTLTFPLLIMLFLMVLPGLISTDALIRDVLLRVSQVIGFFLLFFAFSQFRFTQCKINQLFYLLVFAAIVQIIYATAQLNHNPKITPHFLLFYLKTDSPPVGGFSQVNMLSMFLVTNIVISIYLYFQPSFKKQNLLKKLSLVIVLLGGSYLIFKINSFAALVALLVSVILILLSQKQIIRKTMSQNVWGFALLSSLVLGSVVGAQESGKDIIKHNTNSRVYVWNLSYQAIKDRPMLGHGIGAFSKAFYDQHEKAVSQLPLEKRLKMNFFSHPHNELLYWGVESGVIAILAMLGFILFFLNALRKYSWRYIAKYMALLFPIAFHTQVSYPFYISSIMMVVFLFLATLPLRSEVKTYSVAISESMKKFLIILITAIFIAYIWFVKETIKGGVKYSLFAHTGSKDLVLLEEALKSPYWSKEKSFYAYYSNMKYEIKKGNKKLARKYLSLFEERINREEHSRNYSVLLDAYKLLGEKDKYQELRDKFKLRYPAKMD